jgi:hypothetical protein
MRDRDTIHLAVSCLSHNLSFVDLFLRENDIEPFSQLKPPRPKQRPMCYDQHASWHYALGLSAAGTVTVTRAEHPLHRAVVYPYAPRSPGEPGVLFIGTVEVEDGLNLPPRRAQSPTPSVSAAKTPLF